MCFLLITRSVPVLQLVNGELQTFVPPGALCEGLYKTREAAEAAGKKKTRHGGTFTVEESKTMLNNGD